MTVANVFLALLFLNHSNVMTPELIITMKS